MRSVFFSFYALEMKTIKLMLTAIVLIIFDILVGYICPSKNKLVNIQELLLLLLNLTIIYAVSYQDSGSVFSTVTNVMISLAFIQFCTIVFYHFLTYTCHCNVLNTLQSAKKKIIKLGVFGKRNRAHRNDFDVAMLNIPERTHNYNEYQDELVSADFENNNIYQ